jgi:hypothetical protein
MKDSTKDAGNDAAKGAADGVKEGAPAFNAAMKDLAKGGKEAFEEELKIASPSRNASNGQVDWPRRRARRR